MVLLLSVRVELLLGVSVLIAEFLRRKTFSWTDACIWEVDATAAKEILDHARAAINHSLKRTVHDPILSQSLGV
jgi:hypothetical protein